MSDELIELVRQYKVLYDTKSKDYKDQSIRNAVWEEIAKTLNKSVDSCKEDWTKLRNSYSSVLKRRRNKKSGQAAMSVTPWKYEEQLSFLCPFMESRNTKTNIVLPPDLPVSPSPSTLTSESSPASPLSYDSQFSVNSPASTSKKSGKPSIQELYELMKSSNDLRIKKQNTRQERDMDENDLFFMSMSKEVKTLPKLDQTKIKLDLHTAVSEARIRQLENQQTNKVLQTPINITSYKIIPPQRIISPSQVSQPHQEYQKPLQSPIQSPILYLPSTSTSTPLPSTSTSHSPQQVAVFDEETLTAYYNSADYSDCD